MAITRQPFEGVNPVLLQMLQVTSDLDSLLDQAKATIVEKDALLAQKDEQLSMRDQMIDGLRTTAKAESKRSADQIAALQAKLDEHQIEHQVRALVNDKKD